MDPPPSFAPTLLLAMPQLRDPNFVRSVVLLCEHGAQGALGFVVNRPTEVRAVDAVVLDPPASGDSGLMLWRVARSSRSAASSSSVTTRAWRTASGSPKAST